MASQVPLQAITRFGQINAGRTTRVSRNRWRAHLADGVRLEATCVHNLGQRRLVEWQAVSSVRYPEVDAGMDGLSPGHKCRAGRATARLHVVLRQRDAAIVHLVEVRRRDLAAVRVSTPTKMAFVFVS